MRVRGWLMTATVLAGAFCPPDRALAAANGAMDGASGAGAADNTYVLVRGVRRAVKPTPPVKVPLKSTYTVSIIDRKQIEQYSSMTTAQQLLAREPSVYATNNGPGGVNQNITYRSFNAGQFSQTLDGIGLNDAFNGSVTAQADNDNNVLVTANDFQNIQLYRGINNPAVNSYNSLGGTVNYTTRDPAGTFGGEAGVSYGSFDSLDWHGTVNTGSIDGVTQMLSFDRLSSNGWTQQDKNSVSNLYYAIDAPIAATGTKFYGRFIYDYNSGLVNQLEPVSLLHQYGDTYQLPNYDYNKQNTSTNYALIGGVSQTFTHYLSGDLKAFMSVGDYTRQSSCNEGFAATSIYLVNDCNTAPYHSYNYYARTYGVQPSLKLDLPFNTVQVGANLTVAHLHSSEFFSNSLPIVFASNPQGTGNDFWNEHDYRTLGSVWAEDDISLFDDRLKITPGVKFLWAETKDTDTAAYYYPYTGSVSNYSHYTAPTFGISYELLKGLDAYAAYGENIKFVDISAYYNNIFTNSGIVQPVNVQPEFVKDYEAGLRYQRSGFSIEANYYQEDFLNTFITTTDPTTGNSTTTNGGRSRYEGEELQIGNDFTDFWGLMPGDTAVYINFAHNTAVYTSGFTDQFSGQAVHAGEQVGNVPVYLVAFGGTWHDEGYSVAVNANYVGAQQLTDAFFNTPAGVTQGGYVVTNLQLSDEIPTARLKYIKAVKLSVNIDNLFGVRYYNQADINQSNTGFFYKEAIIGAPRAVYGAITAEF